MAAKDARLYDLAVEIARRSPCDPRTLARAARDFALRQPAFAVEAGVLSLHWIVEGHGYEVTGPEVLDVFSHTMRAAEMTVRQRKRATASGSSRVTMRPTASCVESSRANWISKFGRNQTPTADGRQPEWETR